MVEYDLHIHSTASDGLLEPYKIFEVAKSKNLKGIAITDHDTVNSLGYCEHISKEFNIDFIPGIELSSYYNDYEVHILGYYIDYNNKNLLEFLSFLQNTRIERINKMVDKIKFLGYDISYEEVINEAGNKVTSIGRPHIGRLLVKKGYFKDTTEAFDVLLERGKKGYVERYKLSAKEAVSLIKKSNGLPVIAHPFLIDKNLKIEELENIILKFKDYGIIGIEAFHSLQSVEQSKYLCELAFKNNMIITGGSDCHGILNDGEYMIGSYGIDSSNFKLLKELKG